MCLPSRRDMSQEQSVTCTPLHPGAPPCTSPTQLRFRLVFWSLRLAHQACVTHLPTVAAAVALLEWCADAGTVSKAWGSCQGSKPWARG